MTTIPTELLRTLVTVVDLRSFTKAAQSLGVTQPAVSAQIKRLQALLGPDLFDRSAPGVALTERGDLVVNYARRMLAINDRILHLAEPAAAEPPLRIGIPGDYAGATLPSTLAAFRARSPGLRFHIRGDTSENLLRDLRQGQLDLAVALTIAGAAPDARDHWREEVVWVKSAAFGVAATGAVPLATFGEGCVLHRLAALTLNQAGRDCDVVFTAFSMTALVAAVAAGLGVTLLPRRSVPAELAVADNGTLPQSADLWCGIYLHEGIDREELEQLADTMAEALKNRTEGIAPGRPSGAWPTAPAVAADPAVALHAGGRP